MDEYWYESVVMVNFKVQHYYYLSSSFQTLINPDLTKRGNGYTSSYGAPGRGP